MEDIRELAERVKEKYSTTWNGHDVVKLCNQVSTLLEEITALKIDILVLESENTENESDGD